MLNVAHRITTQRLEPCCCTEAVIAETSFCLDWLPEPSEIPARACTCSFCLKHGGIWTACPTGALEVRILDTAHISEYAFGTRTAVFHTCSRCGAVPVVTSDIAGNTYAVVSVNAFDNVNPGLLRPGPVSFDGEDEETRLSRRAKGWIPSVRFRSGA